MVIEPRSRYVVLSMLGSTPDVALASTLFLH